MFGDVGAFKVNLQERIYDTCDLSFKGESRPVEL